MKTGPALLKSALEDLEGYEKTNSDDESKGRAGKPNSLEGGVSTLRMFSDALSKWFQQKMYFRTENIRCYLCINLPRKLGALKLLHFPFFLVFLLFLFCPLFLLYLHPPLLSLLAHLPLPQLRTVLITSARKFLQQINRP